MTTTLLAAPGLPLLAAPLDPTTSGPLGQILALLGLVAALVVLLRWWFQNRRR